MRASSSASNMPATLPSAPAHQGIDMPPLTLKTIPVTYRETSAAS